MKQINLVPIATREKAGRQRRILGVAAAVVLAAALSGIGHLAIGIQADAAAERIESLRTGQTISASKVTVAGPDLSKRVELLNAQSRLDIDWSRAFAFVGSVLPKEIVLTSYSYVQAPSGITTLKLSGNAPSNVIYATFAESLRADRVHFSASKVDTYGYDPTKGTVAFSMTLTMKSDQISYVTKPQ